MKKILNILLILVPTILFAQEFDFTQEWDTIPVAFDGIECQVPWTTGYNYINPTFCDIDGDNDKDLFFGNDWGRITECINNGDNLQHSYALITDNFVSPPGLEPVSQVPNRPAFCDIDNDGDFDFFLGAYLYYPVSYGRLYYYENTGTINNPEFEFVEEFFQGIEYPYCYYPTFVDIDNDQDFELFFGQGDNLIFYMNEGTPDSASMVLVTEEFLGINLGGYYCIPAFTDIDDDGDQDMFLGDGAGQIHYYRNDGSPVVYNFTEVPGAYGGVNVVNIASPTFCDIDDDGDFDLFVGERSWGEDDRRGDINYYENVGTPDSAVFELITQNFVSLDIGKTAPPAFTDIDNDGLVDIFVGDGDGNINYFSNTGAENAPYFTFETQNFQDISANYQSRPTFGDLDNDGDLDLLVGRAGASVHYYINTGTPEEPLLELRNQSFLGINYEWPAPRLIDIDNDADLDLFVGHLWNQVVYWKNEGNPEIPNFVLEDSSFLSTPYQGEFCPITFGDIDNDGDYDLIRGSVYSQITLYRNTGSAEIPNMILDTEHFLGIDLVHSAEPFLEDIDNDSDLDLFVSDLCGGVSFWRNNEFNSVDNRKPKQPYTFTLHQNYPNPFNASTVTSFKLQVSSKVNLTVYDVLGREVTSLFTGYLSAGYHEVVWDAKDLASGVYLVRLTVPQGAETPQHSMARKVMLIK